MPLFLVAMPLLLVAVASLIAMACNDSNHLPPLQVHPLRRPQDLWFFMFFLIEADGRRKEPMFSGALTGWDKM